MHIKKNFGLSITFKSLLPLFFFSSSTNSIHPPNACSPSSLKVHLSSQLPNPLAKPRYASAKSTCRLMHQNMHQINILKNCIRKNVNKIRDAQLVQMLKNSSSTNYFLLTDTCSPSPLMVHPSSQSCMPLANPRYVKR